MKLSFYERLVRGACYLSIFGSALCVLELFDSDLFDHCGGVIALVFVYQLLLLIPGAIVLKIITYFSKFRPPPSAARTFAVKLAIAGLLFEIVRLFFAEMVGVQHGGSCI